MLGRIDRDTDYGALQPLLRGRIAVQVGGAEHDACGSQPRRLHQIGPAAAVALGAHVLVKSAPNRAGHGAGLSAAGHKPGNARRPARSRCAGSARASAADRFNKNIYAPDTQTSTGKVFMSPMHWPSSEDVSPRKDLQSPY